MVFSKEGVFQQPQAISLKTPVAAEDKCHRDVSPITKGDVQAGDGLSFLTLLGEAK
jgi:hypothetical protein